ncbi:MAG: CARDB domain-containing protein [Hyphomicrobiales bacterium]
MTVVTTYTEGADTTLASHPTLAKTGTFSGTVSNDASDAKDYFEIDIGGDGFNDTAESLTPGSQLTITFQPANGYFFDVDGLIDSYENIRGAPFIITNMGFLHRDPINSPNGSNTITWTVPSTGLPPHATLIFEITGQADAAHSPLSYTITLSSPGGGGGGGGGGSDPPDLTATIDNVSASSAKAGDAITVDYHWQNLGGKLPALSASQDAPTFEVYLSSDTNVTTSDIKLAGSLRAALRVFLQDEDGQHSGSITEKFALPTNLTPGTYYIGVIADAHDTVTESNEGNNVSAVVPITIAGSNTYSGHSYSFVSFDGKAHTFAEASAEAKARWVAICRRSRAKARLRPRQPFRRIDQQSERRFHQRLGCGDEGTWQWTDGPDAGTTFWDNGVVGGQFSVGARAGNTTNNPESELCRHRGRR